MQKQAARTVVSNYQTVVHHHPETVRPAKQTCGKSTGLKLHAVAWLLFPSAPQPACCLVGSADLQGRANPRPTTRWQNCLQDWPTGTQPKGWSIICCIFGPTHLLHVQAPAPQTSALSLDFALVSAAVSAVLVEDRTLAGSKRPGGCCRVGTASAGARPAGSA